MHVCGHPGVPDGTGRMTSQVFFHICLSQRGVRRRGATSMWVDCCCLTRAMRNCSKATLAAAVGGNQTNKPFLRTDLANSSPCCGCVHPRMSCPSSHQSLGLRTSRPLQDHEEIQGRKSGAHSRAERCRGMKEGMGSLAITPLFKSPRDTPLPPLTMII
jgi:hypothetical protein